VLHSTVSFWSITFALKHILTSAQWTSSVCVWKRNTEQFHEGVNSHHKNKLSFTKHQHTKSKLISVAWVRERNIPAERPPHVGEVPIFADRGCHVVSVSDPHARILEFLNRSRYLFFQIAPQLYSRGWVDPVRDPLLLRKSGSAGNRTRTKINDLAVLISLDICTEISFTFTTVLCLLPTVFYPRILLYPFPCLLVLSPYIYVYVTMCLLLAV
jgi:hypothetical protein